MFVVLLYIVRCSTIKEVFGDTKIASQKYVDDNIKNNKTKICTDDEACKDHQQSDTHVPSMKYVNNKFSSDSMLDNGVVNIKDKNIVDNPENLSFSGTVDFANGTIYKFTHITYTSEKVVYVDGNEEFILKYDKINKIMQVCNKAANNCYDTTIDSAVYLDKKFATEQFVIDEDDRVLNKIKSVIV